MRKQDTETRMRDLEYFRGLRLLPGAWTVLRLDGRGFTRFTAGRFEKPFDVRLRDLMTTAARAVLEDFQGLYGVTHSDEISIVFPPQWCLFDRRLEKLVSVSAGLASAAFTQACGKAAHFDSRAWQGVSEQDVVTYFRWRQEEAARCALHSWCYWTLRHHGMDGEAAVQALRGKGKDFQNELLFQHGLNFNDLPTWQRRGVGLYWEAYEKPGFDPLCAEPVMAQRRRVRIDAELPMAEAYEEFVRRLLCAIISPRK
jgi:tRNA(His) 5'-end guanylyltransferase